MEKRTIRIDTNQYTSYRDNLARKPQQNRHIAKPHREHRHIGGNFGTVRRDRHKSAQVKVLDSEQKP